VKDEALAWLKDNDPDYGQMGEDVYGDVYGISTRRRAYRRQKHERNLRSEIIDQHHADHCPACHRKRLIAANTVG